MEEPVTVSLGISEYSDTDGRYLSMTAVLSTGGPMPSKMVVRRSSAEPQWRSPTGSECQFSPIAVDLSAQSVWGSFVCPTLDYMDGDEECQVTEGYFYFENCKPREI